MFNCFVKNFLSFHVRYIMPKSDRTTRSSRSLRNQPARRRYGSSTSTRTRSIQSNDVPRNHNVNPVQPDNQPLTGNDTETNRVRPGNGPQLGHNPLTNPVQNANHNHSRNYPLTTPEQTINQLITGNDTMTNPVQIQNQFLTGNNNGTTASTPHANSSPLDVNALTDQITKTVTSAVLDNLRAAGLFVQGQSTGASVITQTPGVNQATPVIQGTNNHPSLTSANTSFTTMPTEHNLSFPQSSFNAHASAAKSGFISAAIPLHARVPMKTKEKIWNNEFVELSTLFDEESDDITISLKSGKISTTNSSKRKFMSIEQWTDAFNVFMSVYRLKFPEQSEHLATYLNTVRKIANENGHWHFYDTNFRKIMHSIGLQWNQIHSELYVTALTRKQKQPFRSGRDLPASGRSRQDNAIKGTCNRFNKGAECSGCQYKHICRHCGGRHPGFRCWKEHSSRYNGNQSTQSPQQSAMSTDSKSSKIPIPTNPSSSGTSK